MLSTLKCRLNAVHHSLLKAILTWRIFPRNPSASFLTSNLQIKKSVNIVNILRHKKLSYSSYFEFKSTPVFPTNRLPNLHPDFLITHFTVLRYISILYLIHLRILCLLFAGHVITGVVGIL